MVSAANERMSDAEQAVILGRLLVDQRRLNRALWVRWLLQVTLILALVWTVSLLRKPVPSLSLWNFQDPELVLGRLRAAASHFALQAVIFFLLGLLLSSASSRAEAAKR
jgi:hypothetical protein